jgi:hypothetical protein
VTDVLIVDPVGDGDDAIWRVSRIRPQILPSNELAYSDKTRYVAAPQLLFWPGALIEEGVSAVQGLDDRNASRRGRSDKPFSCTMYTDNVRPVCREPLLDVVMCELDDLDTVEAKRVVRFFVGAIPWGMRYHVVEAVRR